MTMYGVMVGLVVSVSAFAQAATNFSVCATADKVNVRVRPEAGSEVVAQIREGQWLEGVRVEGDWIGIRAPTNTAVWVKSQFLKKGVVTGGKIKLRAGPGISYRDMGLLMNATPVSECETHGDWTRILAPQDLVVWVSSSMVTTRTGSVTTPVPAAELPVPPVRMAVDDTVSTPVPLPADLPVGLSKDQLAPLPGQGRRVERAGTVEQLPLAFLRDIRYRLVDTQGGRKVTLCFLQGNDSQMPSLAGRRLTVKGREFWLKGQPCSVIYPELITPVLE